MTNFIMGILLAAQKHAEQGHWGMSFLLTALAVFLGILIGFVLVAVVVTVVALLVRGICRLGVMRAITITLIGVGVGNVAGAATTPAPSAALSATAQTVVIHDEDIIPLTTSRNETTLIVLPEKEKVVGVFCGDKTYWDVDVIPGAERYIAVKPSKAGTTTDIHIVTDHNNSYTFQAVEGGPGPVSLKVFVKPSDSSSLEKPPVFVSAAAAEQLKQELAESQAALKKVQAESVVEVKAKEGQIRATYPDTMKFNYNFKKDKPPFNVEEVWHDDKFTYIRAHPTEAPALYEYKDGKPNLIQFEMQPDGMYFVSKILDRGYLQAGKQRLDIWK